MYAYKLHYKVFISKSSKAHEKGVQVFDTSVAKLFSMIYLYLKFPNMFFFCNTIYYMSKINTIYNAFHLMRVLMRNKLKTLCIFNLNIICKC